MLIFSCKILIAQRKMKYEKERLFAFSLFSFGLLINMGKIQIKESEREKEGQK